MVAIIGIFLGVAVLSTDLVNFDRKIERELQRLDTRIRFTSEESLMQGRDFGIIVYAEGYEFRAFQYQQGWLPADGPGMEGMRLEPDMAMRLILDGREVVLEPYCKLFACGSQLAFMDEEDRIEASPVPQIVLFSTGEITPFELDLYRQSEAYERGYIHGYRLDMEFNGDSELGWHDY